MSGPHTISVRCLVEHQLEHSFAGLPEDKVIPALECLQQNVNPEIASYLGRLPEKGAGFVRSACKSGENFEDLMRYVWTEDYLADLNKADKICEAKF